MRLRQSYLQQIPFLLLPFFLSAANRVVQNGGAAASAVKYAVKSNMFAHTLY